VWGDLFNRPVCHFAQSASQRRKGPVAGASILLPHFAVYLWTFQWKKRIFFAMSKGKNTEAQKSEVLQGTLDLMARE